MAHGASKTRLRVVHFSVQDDHVHLVVEAPDREPLCGGASGIAIRLARAHSGQPRPRPALVRGRLRRVGAPAARAAMPSMNAGQSLAPASGDAAGTPGVGA